MSSAEARTDLQKRLGEICAAEREAERSGNTTQLRVLQQQEACYRNLIGPVESEQHPGAQE